MALLEYHAVVIAQKYQAFLYPFSHGSSFRFHVWLLGN